MTISVEDSILNFFTDVRKTLSDYDEYANRHRELDFLKMRRFLHTTYKTLHEIDPTFMAHHLINLWKHLESIASTYDDFCTKDKIGVHSYEVVFLHHQENFASYEGRLAHNADEITYLRNLTEKFKENVVLQKETLARASKLSGEYAKLEMDLKRLRTRENNAIVRLGELIEENTIINNALEDFRKTHEDQFVKAFNKFIYNVRPNLISILNAMAFEFDIDLWHKAKESAIIQAYFRNANAGGVVSSKTYLKYFLKHLDENKLSKENQELKELYQYLSQNNNMSILLYLPDEDDTQRFTNALVADSASFEIHTAKDAKSALSFLLSKDIPVMIVDADIEQRTIASLLRVYTEKDAGKAVKTKIVLAASEVDDAAIAEAENLKVNSLIEREIEPIEIIDTIYSLI